MTLSVIKVVKYYFISDNKSLYFRSNNDIRIVVVTKRYNNSEKKEEAKLVEYSLTPPFPKEFLIDITSLCNHTAHFALIEKWLIKKMPIII